MFVWICVCYFCRHHIRTVVWHCTCNGEGFSPSGGCCHQFRCALCSVRGAAVLSSLCDTTRTICIPPSSVLPSVPCQILYTLFIFCSWIVCWFWVCLFLWHLFICLENRSAVSFVWHNPHHTSLVSAAFSPLSNPVHIILYKYFFRYLFHFCAYLGWTLQGSLFF